MIKALNGVGSVMVAVHPGVSSVTDRVRGFKETIGTIKGIRLLGELPVWGDPRSNTATQLKGLLGKLRSLNAVFCINDEIALGAVSAVAAADKTGQVTIVGFDGTIEAREAIKRGAIYGDVVQYPSRIGELTAKAIHDHFSGISVPRLITVEVGVITAVGAVS